MDPLGDENGILVLFGLSAIAVLVAAFRAQSSRHPIAAGTLLGVLCAMAVYAVIALISIIMHGTGGYQLGTWLVVVGIGLLPAAVIGLVEGFAASLIVRFLA